jgi:hypothetical protein
MKQNERFIIETHEAFGGFLVYDDKYDGDDKRCFVGFFETKAEALEAIDTRQTEDK